MARHIFVRVAVPIGIVFLGTILAADYVLQDRLHRHVTEAVSSRQKHFDSNWRDTQDRARRWLGEIAAHSGLAEAPSSKLSDPLDRLAAGGEADLYAVLSPEGRLIRALVRTPAGLRPADAAIPSGHDVSIIEVDNEPYFVMKAPIRRAGSTAGWLAGGYSWKRLLPADDAIYVLARGGFVDRVSAGDSLLQPGDRLPQCDVPDKGCAVTIGEERMYLLRSTAGSGGVFDTYLLRSYDAVAGPVRDMSRKVMLWGAGFSVLISLILALLTSRAVSVPLRAITASCAQARDTGQLPDRIRIPASRIEEVNVLAETLCAASESIQNGREQLTQAYLQFMGAIVAMLDARDAYTAGHSHRVSAYSEALAREFGLCAEEIDTIRVAALLHDIGKIGVPDEILRKHDRLTEDEFRQMKQHPTIGKDILERVGLFGKYLDAVELHHENLDGTGYPRGLKGEQIPLAARIVKVADVYDALSTDRPYRSRLPRESVIMILRQSAGAHFDRRLVEVFLQRCLPRIDRQNGDLAALSKVVGTRSGATARV